MRWWSLIICGSLLWLILNLFASSVGLAENDTATSTNILPNAGTTSSSRDNFDLDGAKVYFPTNSFYEDFYIDLKSVNLWLF